MALVEGGAEGDPARNPMVGHFILRTPCEARGSQPVKQWDEYFVVDALQNGRGYLCIHNTSAAPSKLEWVDFPCHPAIQRRLEQLAVTKTAPVAGPVCGSIHWVVLGTATLNPAPAAISVAVAGGALVLAGRGEVPAAVYGGTATAAEHVAMVSRGLPPPALGGREVKTSSEKKRNRERDRSKPRKSSRGRLHSHRQSRSRSGSSSSRRSRRSPVSRIVSPMRAEEYLGCSWGKIEIISPMSAEEYLTWRSPVTSSLLSVRIANLRAKRDRVTRTVAAGSFRETAEVVSPMPSTQPGKVDLGGCPGL